MDLLKNYQATALFELRFWLQILGDHGRFIRDSLSPTEKESIEMATQYIHTFDQLLQTSRQSLSNSDILKLATVSKQLALQLRTFKLSIIEQLLLKQITISLPPSFINHMVNELDEFLRILDYLTKETVPPVVHPLHHDLIWLLDAAGHAGAINDRLDATEKDLKMKSKAFSQQFEDFYLKAVELAGFLRTNLSTFPALSKFHHDVDLELTIFNVFLRELEEMELTKQTLSVLSPLMADHMAREECYYLTKLSESTNVVKQPSCDPTKPRTNSP
ncbi:DUF2935 domain-containing protein [Bacillus salitolerans]|uniref:DUF2935 domain-containing protein n=1 Tax=Bacillus salitolerans TaxID=1437434 RepID=A0ABW4LU24_9BACI